MAGGVTSLPVPESCIADGEPAALWLMDREVDLVPAEVGVKVRVTICAVAPALTVKVEGLAANCAASVPVMAMLVMLSVALLVLPTVKVAVPEVPTLTGPTETEVLDSEMTGASVVVAWVEAGLLLPVLSTAASL